MPPTHYDAVEVQAWIQDIVQVLGDAGNVEDEVAEDLDFVERHYNAGLKEIREDKDLNNDACYNFEVAHSRVYNSSLIKYVD